MAQNLYRISRADVWNSLNITALIINANRSALNSLLPLLVKEWRTTITRIRNIQSTAPTKAHTFYAKQVIACHWTLHSKSNWNSSIFFLNKFLCANFCVSHIFACFSFAFCTNTPTLSVDSDAIFYGNENISIKTLACGFWVLTCDRFYFLFRLFTYYVGYKFFMHNGSFVWA